jgi:hypothetical protein
MTKDEILAAMHEAGAGQADEIPGNYEGVIDVFTRFAAITYAAVAKDKTLKPLTYEQIAELNLSAVTTTDAVNDVRAIELAHGIGVKND